MIRVGVDARLAYMPGVGRYIRCLLQGLSNPRSGVEPIVYVASDTALPLPDLQTRSIPVAPFSIAEQAYWPMRIARDRLDLFHSPHYLAPLFSPRPLVLTIHDLAYHHFPPEGLGFLPLLLYYRVMNRVATARARAIIAVSSFTRGEVGSRLRVDLRKVRVVPNALEPKMKPQPSDACESVRTKYRLPADFVLYLGTYKPWKNLPTLLNAFREVSRHRPECALVLCGKKARNEDDLTQHLRDLAQEGRVVSIGEVAERDLPALYAAARLFVLPSLHEGFGLPVLEAMGCGTPVITSSAGALPEVVGDAAVIVDPLDVQGWSEAIMRLWDEPGVRASLTEAGIARAKEFSIENMARDTIRTYEEVLAS
jgi:glycosyltransferase involved in cell wall biosynthesis